MLLLPERWPRLPLLPPICISPHGGGVVTDISGKHVGALFGLMNSLGVPGAVASQLYLGRFVDWRTDHGFSGRAAWDPGMYAYVGVLCLGACGWFFLDATRSAVAAATADKDEL
jgi:ACS family glucarate transporter-like MFS transporter